MEFNKENLLEIVKRGLIHASGNASLTATQMAFTVAEYVNDEFNVSAIGSYESTTGMYSLVIDATSDRPGHLVTWSFIQRDMGDQIGECYPQVNHRHLDHHGNPDVAKEYSTISNALRNDADYLWSWFCNVVMPIQDATNLSRYEATVAAARLLQHLWKVDVTTHPNYIEQLAECKPSSSAVTHEEAFNDPDTNHVYVNVTGFGPTSGATAFAKRLHLELQGQGYTTFLHVADTTLSQDQVTNAVPTDTVFSLTAVESRTHTDLHLYSGDPTVEDAPGYDECDDEESSLGFGDDPDQGLDDNEEPGDPFSATSLPEHELEIELQDTDVHPVLTIKYFQDNLPGTKVKAKYKVDAYLTDAIHEMFGVGSTVKIEVDPQDPAPENTVAAIQELWLDSNPEQSPLLKVTDYKPTLSDPYYLKNAYVLHIAGEAEVCIMHVDTESPDFDVSVFHLNGIDAYPTSDIGAFIKALEEDAPTALEYLETLVANNRRWTETYRPLTAWNEAIKGATAAPFTLYSIPQGAIPKSIYDLVESCWTDWQQTVKLEDLGREIGDPTVNINFDQYITKTQGGFMVVREHPRLEELFLKLLQTRARDNKVLAKWLTVMGH